MTVNLVLPPGTGRQVLRTCGPGNSWRNDIMPYLPANAGSQAFTIEQSHDALSPWAGLGVLCLYAATAIAIGVLLVDRRDV